MSMYCLKCKKNTETQNEQQRTAKNGRNMLSGTCSVCGTKKNKFIKK